MSLLSCNVLCEDDNVSTGLKMNKIIRTYTFIGLLITGLFYPASVNADPGSVQLFLQRQYAQPIDSIIRITPPNGGYVMLHREGKPVRWIAIPTAIRVESWITYTLTAVINGNIVFNSGIVARIGILDVYWLESNNPIVHFYPPIVTNPFAIGLVPIGSASIQTLRAPIGNNGFLLMLDELQVQMDDRARWVILMYYTKQWLFTIEQANMIISSFQYAVFRRSAAQLLEQRRFYL